MKFIQEKVKNRTKWTSLPIIRMTAPSVPVVRLRSIHERRRSTASGVPDRRTGSEVSVQGSALHGIAREVRTAGRIGFLSGNVERTLPCSVA